MKKPHVACLLLIFAWGCADYGDGTMVALSPPGQWEPRLAGYRESRDRYFRESPESPLLAQDIPEFEGLDYWEPDPSYHFVGPLHTYAEPEPLTLITTAGKQRPCAKIGWLAFRVGDEVQRLQVYRLLDTNQSDDVEGLLIPFTDGTTGTETYPSGRYVKLQGPQGGPYVLDFNRAHNPSCAYGSPERFACPVTPPENRLQVRIEAGERGFKEPPAGT